MRSIKKLLILLFCFVTIFCVVGCDKKPGEKDNEKSKVEINDPVTEDPADKHPDLMVTVPSYEALDTKLVKDGKTDYAIIVSNNASSTTYTAANELNTFMQLATGASFPIIKDDEAEWSTTEKYISIGDNQISRKAGIALPASNDNGFIVRTFGNSIFLMGKRDIGNVFAVYELLARTLNYTFYAADEIVYAKTTELACPNFDIFRQPDFEYMSSPMGYVSALVSTRYKFSSASFMYPHGGAQWHNSFDYIPYETYGENHPGWFATDLKNICYTARGNEEEYNLLIETVVEKMKSVITLFPDGNTLTFTHEDVGTWCTCSACSALRQKYGTNSASVIMFMNDVVSKVEAWREDTYPERDNIRYIFFAYTATIEAPVKVENGKIVPIDDKVKPIDKIGVMYAPISSDFIHGKSEPQNSSQLQQMKEWHALVGENIYYWFYQTYFYNYFLFYNNFDSMQDNYRTALECGGVWMYDQSQWNNAISSGFQILKAYLESNLLWDVDADVSQLTDEFFKYYFKAAADDMRELFDSIRLNYLWMSETLGVSGWIGTRINTTEYFKLNTLLEWQNIIEKAYSSIEYLKESDNELYQKLYDRICLESLKVRYLIIDLYGQQVYLESELLDKKLNLKTIVFASTLLV